MRIAKLNLRDWAVLAHMLWLLAKLEALQHLLPLPALIQRFDARPQARKRAIDPDRLTWLSGALLHRLYRDRYCMKQSLLLFYFLRKWKYPVCIHFGIAKKGDTLAGHAWISLGGEPFHEAHDPEDTYRTIFSYPLTKTKEVSL